MGVGAVKGLPPHITGAALLQKYGLKPGSAEAYALSSVDFAKLAGSYDGSAGSTAWRRPSTPSAPNARAGRCCSTAAIPGRGDYISLKSRGGSMVSAMNALGVDAMTAHWEFTYGAGRVKEIVNEELKFPFLAGNVRDTEWNEGVFDSTKYFERGGVSIAVIGQAFPFTPIANPRYLMENWSFGIREKDVRRAVAAARRKADLVVLLSHNGFDVDRKLASRVDGIDVILTGHTHDALPEAVRVGNTLLIASGSHGKFLSRLDLEVKNRKVAAFRYRLIPLFSDAIAPDPKMKSVLDRLRAPHRAVTDKVIGRTDTLLYRRGNFNGTFDDLICNALLEERDAEISLSPGFRWGASLVPGQDITLNDVYNQTAITYPAVYRLKFTGSFLKTVLEDVADNIFNPDPYYQQGGDMVRVGGLNYDIDIGKPIGKRISNMTLMRNGEPVDPAKEYTVAGWASVNPGTQGPPIYDVVAGYIARKKVIAQPARGKIRVSGA